MPSMNIGSALFGRGRQAVLAILFCHSDESFHTRHIVRSVGMGYGAVQRELARLVEAGLVTRSRSGNQVLYQANKECAVFAELRGLMVKTAGVADVLRASLAALSDRIDAAFVYGSVASGSERADSDVDLMVIGNVTLRDVSDNLRTAEEELRREVNPGVFTSDEFRERALAEEHFVTSVLAEPKIFLIGNEDELTRITGRG
jgi:uncharacterized protein